MRLRAFATFAATATLCLGIGVVASVATRAPGPDPVPVSTVKACEAYPVTDARWQPCAMG